MIRTSGAAWLGSIIAAVCIGYTTGQAVAQQTDADPTPAVYLHVGDDFQRIVNAHPAGTHYIVQSGIHREQKVIPNDGDTFTGEPGAVMKGSRVLTGWQPAGSNWVTTLTKPIAPGLENGQCSDYGDTLQNGDLTGVQGSIRLGLSCIYPEMLFVTDISAHTFSVLTRVKDPSELGPGKWYFDYNCPGHPPICTDPLTQKIYTGDDYRSPRYVVELSVTPYAFGYDVLPGKGGFYTPDRCNPPDQPCQTPLPTTPADLPDPYRSSDVYAYKPRNVTIKNLTIEQYANPAQTGAIGYQRPGLDWVIIGNEVSYNHGCGIKFKGKAIVRGNYAHHNGQCGIAAGDANTTPDRGGELEEYGFYGGYCGSGGLVKFNEIAYNRLAEVGILPEWEAGGTKFTQCFNLTVDENYVHHNDGSGLWSDTSYSGTSDVDNDVRNNNHEGIMIETTLGPTKVVGNKVEFNSSYITEDNIKGGQIFISNSPDVNVHHNIVVAAQGFGNGITIWNANQRQIEGVLVSAVGNDIHYNQVTSVGDGTDNLGITGGQGETDQEVPQSIFYDVGVNTFHHNAYHVSNNCTVGQYWRWDRPPFHDNRPPYLNFLEWQRYGQDRRGSCDNNIRF